MSTHIQSCLHCGSPCTEHAFSDLCRNNDPSSILDDIDRLDKAIDRLRMLRFERFRQLNTVRSSTNFLPNEILLSIFKKFCSSFTSRRFPQFILGSVCYHWRNLINGDPQFWQTINLDLHDDRGISRAFSLVDVFKRRNGASFKFASLDFENLCRPIHAHSLFSALGTVLSIQLQNPPDYIVAAMSERSILHKVSVVGPEWDKVYDESPRARFKNPWSSLTNLHLTRIKVDYCCEFLLGCPNLIEFHSSTTARPSRFVTPLYIQQAQKMDFPHIQHLTWGHYYSEWDNHFLSFYRFPALQHFCWEGANSNHSLLLYRDFTTFLPQSCQTLQLSAFPDNSALLDPQLLWLIKHPIKRLICSRFYPHTIAKAFEALQNPTFIPSLTFFRWERHHLFMVKSDDLIKISRSLKGAIQGRKEIGGRFRMEIEGMVFPKGYNKENSHELIGGGFDFEMTEDNCWIISF